MTNEETIRQAIAAFGVMLGQIGYDNGACRVNEPIGGVLTYEVLTRARLALSDLRTIGDGTKRWLVFNVGCIECGVDSAVVGTYDTEQEAEAIANICESSLAWRQDGQNSFEVFDLTAPQAEEYAEAIGAAPSAFSPVSTPKQTETDGNNGKSAEPVRNTYEFKSTENKGDNSA